VEGVPITIRDPDTFKSEKYEQFLYEATCSCTNFGYSDEEVSCDTYQPYWSRCQALFQLHTHWNQFPILEYFIDGSLAYQADNPPTYARLPPTPPERGREKKKNTLCR